MKTIKIIALLPLFLLASCGNEKHVHDWDMFTGVCKTCGESCEHTFMNGKNKCSICGYVCRHKKGHNQEGFCDVCHVEVPHNFINHKCDTCDKYTEFEAEETPSSYMAECAHKGKVFNEEYVTYLYDEEGKKGETIKKALNVYLPYSYNEENTYDFLYLYHGAGGQEGLWFGINTPSDDYAPLDKSYTCNVLDNLIEQGLAKKMIVVTPSLYYDNENQLSLSATARTYELINDIIPLVESKYKGYSNFDVNNTSLISSRTHRALAGLSMGSVFTLTALPKTMHLFSYYGCFSCGLETNYEDYYKQIADQWEDYPINYWYNACGYNDTMCYKGHKELYEEMLKLDNGKHWKADENINFLQKNKNAHTYRSWLSDLYNITQKFFK